MDQLNMSRSADVAFARPGGSVEGVLMINPAASALDVLRLAQSRNRQGIAAIELLSVTDASDGAIQPRDVASLLAGFAEEVETLISRAFVLLEERQAATGTGARP